MRKILVIIFLGVVFKSAFSQTEELTSLKFNPATYYSKSNQSSGNQYKYLVSGNTVVSSVTSLSLPFIDDFSTDRTPNYLWLQQNTTDTFFNVVGGCLNNDGIMTSQGAYMTVPSWNYTWDVVNKVLDSTQQQSLKFTFFSSNGTNCLTGSPISTALYWPTYYTYTFDSATGVRLDSALVIDPTHTDTLTYAPVIYFAKAQSGTLWFDDYAYINNTFPINPPTIGVATLDGLDQFGLPYNNATGVGGQADYLTSNPVNLKGLTVADSVYLSFFFEPKGLGDYPDVVDSLIVEFRDNGGIWRTVWFNTGYSDPQTVPDTFQQILIRVPAIFPESYFDTTFQFRFRNMVSEYGSNNHWHIDYVKLDKNRSAVDTVIHDRAFIYPFPTILKNYTQEPATQINFPDDLTDSIVLTVRNLDPSSAPATPYSKSANELYPASQIVQSPVVQTFNAGPYTTITMNPSSEYQNLPTGPVDSLVVTSRIFIEPNDSRPLNDTLKHTQSFTSVMAYDDGSAEKAYGLTGLGLKKFGYEFDLNRPDTLAAFQVMFTQIEANVSDLIFNFAAWDSLRLNDYLFIDTPFYTMVNQKPFYIDSVNGFCTFKLDTPIIISGKFYFGWEQTDDRRLQVGYDLNSPLGRNHMFVYLNHGVWDTSTINTVGSPMIRLIFSGNWWGSSSQTTGVIDLTKGKDIFNIFPNPTSGKANLQGNNSNTSYSVDVMNTLGQRVQYYTSVQRQINLSNLPNGVYLLVSTDLQTGKIYRNKIIKTSF